MAKQVLTAILFVLLIVGTLIKGFDLETDRLKIDLSIINTKNFFSSDIIKLAKTKKGNRLFFSETNSNGSNYETIISSIEFSNDPDVAQINFTISQILPPPPNWDITITLDGSLLIVYEMAGGATNDLWLDNDQGKRFSVRGGRPFASFTYPRFVKRLGIMQGEKLSVLEDSKLVALVQKTKPELYESNLELLTANKAVIVPHKKNYLIFYRKDIPGVVRGDDLPPGVLHWRILGSDFVPLELGGKVFGDKTIFEFDVDILGEQAAILATSKEGFVLASGLLNKDSFDWKFFEEKIRQNELISPTLLAEENIFQFAFLEMLPNDEIRIIRGIGNKDSKK
jgi:hypothetical protein